MFRLADYDEPLTRGGKVGASRYGEYRARRLRKAQPTTLLAWVIDLTWSTAFPATFGVCIAALAVAMLQIDAVDTWVKDNPVSPQVVTSLSTLVAFIISLRLSQNLTDNATSINAFNDVCGSVINIAIWSRSLVSNDQFQIVTLPDGKGGMYQTTRIGLLLASVPYAVRYTFRGDLDIPFEELPVGGDPSLLARANNLTTTRDGFASVSPFTALLMMIGEFVHALEDNGEIKPGELGALFKQIDALTAAEGTIASRVTFSYPRILRALLYAVFFAWLFLLSLTDIGPSSGWNTLWLVGLLSLSSVGLYAMSNRYSNPFTIRSKDSTQTPLVGIASRQAETAIDGVFAFRNGGPKPLGPAVLRP